MVFIILEGSFKPTVMFFGLSNLPAIFQTMINELLRDLINTGKVGSFIDNIIVGTESEEEHDKIDFLEVVIGPEGIKMEKVKVKAVLDWPVSKLVKDIQKFLKLANYYRRFVEELAKITRPLHELTKKEQKWEWRSKQEKLFKALKKKFITEPILVVLDLDRKIRMEVNASDYAMGGVLSMECSDRW